MIEVNCKYYQYIKILTCVCVCVCVCMTEVVCSWGGTRLDVRTLNLEYCEECSRTLGPCMGWNLSGQLGCSQGAAVEADAIGEQQLKQTQSGSSS